MAFLQPYMLWGLLALSIPIIIHFWYQKKGKTISWAASQWLIDKTSLQHRGLRLDELPLLLIRCLLIILFVLLLSKPIINWLKPEHTTEKIHLVEPNDRLVDNFKFELESAIKNGEKVFWIGPLQEEIKDISTIPKQTNNELYLQQTIQKLNKQGTTLNLYINNNQKLAELPKIYVPGSFKLFTYTDSLARYSSNYLDLDEGKKLYVNQKPGGAAQLKVTNATDKDQTVQFESAPVHKGKIQVLVDYKNAAEQQTVQAALQALSEVYSIPFAIDLTVKSANKYDWIFTDQKIKEINPQTLYMVSGENSNQYSAGNVIQIQDSLRLSTSELVQNGQLPEWLGNIMVAHYKLKENKNPLSQVQLRSLFISVKPVREQFADKSYQCLLLFFVLTLLLERWIALRKLAGQTYA